MKQIILIVLIGLYAQTINAQADSTDTTWHSIMPEFKGGEKAIRKIISENMVYPKQAMKDRIGGKIETQFTVDSLGNIIDIKVIDGIREDLDNEAIRLVGLLKDWTPGSQNGKKVNVKFKLPLHFYPDKKFMRKYLKEHNMTM